MPKKLKRPTAGDEARIQAGIAADRDAFELTDTDFAKMRPAADVVPQLVKRRGPQKAAVKEQISVRLDRDLVERLRSTGPGWQGRINATLRKVVMK